MNENKCPYCHETADECESVKLLFIDEKFKKSTYDYVAQAWIWLDRLHFEVIVPMLDYHIPRFEFFKNIKINYCPMCGRKLIVAERRKTKMKEKYLTKQDLVNELKKRDREGKKFALRFEVSMLQNKINRLQETLENNKSYLDFIDSLKLMVNVDLNRLAAMLKDGATAIFVSDQTELPVDDDKDKPAKGQMSLLDNGTK